ncbi:MAG: tryptophan synthase subunit alpha [Nitrososphaerales archaeon]
MKGSGISKIDNAFSSAKESKKHALIGFLTCGDPSPKATPRLVQSLIEGGVDIIELGIPFSDPIADGPVIQAADVRALDARTTPESALRIVNVLSDKVPVVLLTYFNPILRMGAESFLAEASKNKVSGIVVPDLLSGSNDGKKFAKEAKESGIAMILMAAPSTESERLAALAASTQGFLYLVSLLGVTGSRRAKSSVSESSLEFIRHASRVAREKSKRTAVGFGISRPEHVKQVIRAGADGVIVGSSFVNVVASNRDDINRACRLLTKYARKLKDAT